jgi:hypothetical protein
VVNGQIFDSPTHASPQTDVQSVRLPRWLVPQTEINGPRDY